MAGSAAITLARSTTAAAGSATAARQRRESNVPSGTAMKITARNPMV